MNNTYVAINRKVFDMFKEINNSHTHLTLDERRIILTGITNGSTKTAIAQTIGKDKSTIAKEIKLHRTISHKCGFPLECANSENAHLDENAQQIVPSIRRFTATDATDPPEHVMAVLNGRTAVTTSIRTIRKKLMPITKKRLLK